MNQHVNRIYNKIQNVKKFFSDQGYFNHLGTIPTLFDISKIND